MPGLTIKELLEKARAPLQLESLTGDLAGRQPVTTSDVNRPGLALAGYLSARFPRSTSRA